MWRGRATIARCALYNTVSRLDAQHQHARAFTLIPGFVFVHLEVRDVPERPIGPANRTKRATVGVDHISLLKRTTYIILTIV